MSDWALPADLRTSARAVRRARRRTTPQRLRKKIPPHKRRRRATFREKIRQAAQGHRLEARNRGAIAPDEARYIWIGGIAQDDIVIEVFLPHTEVMLALKAD